jgi:hypothetical protein
VAILRDAPNSSHSKTLIPWILAALAALPAAGPAAAAALAPPASAAASPRVVAAAGPPPPTFQVVGQLGDLAVIDPSHLLAPAVFIQPDGLLPPVAVTGMAVDPAGRFFVVGTDQASSWLAAVTPATGAETTIGKLTGYVVVDLAFDGAGNLFGLTASSAGSSPHSLLRIDTATAAVAVARVLDAHGTNSGFVGEGAIAWNPGDGSLYYADLDASNHVFVDRLAPGTFTQTPVVSTSLTNPPKALAFSQGKLWLFTFSNVFAADAASLGAGFTFVGTTVYPTPDGTAVYFAEGAVPNTLACVASPTAGCLASRFRVEVTYDATPANGTGPANVVLESAASVKFTFFDPTNVEVILKILDACTFNHKWWVFAGGLTDVGVQIKVTDTATGAVKHYSSAKGHLFQTFADTAAFSCP